MTTTTTNEDTTPAATAADPATAAATATDPAVATTAATTTEGSLLDGVTATTTATATATTTGDDWLPEKFRVNGADGKLDEAASARKLAESYKALEAHKGPLPQVPATPDDYKIEGLKDAEGKDVDPEVLASFTGDPLFKSFAKDAHAKNITNEQLSFIVGRYLDVAPRLLAADQALSLEEAKAELSTTLWKDEQTMKANLAGVVRAINGFGAEADDVPGSRSRLMAKYGRDPDFIAFAASVAAEMKEDVHPSDAGASTDADIESLQKSKAYWDKNDPQHAQVKAKVESFYTKKFGSKRR